MCLCDRRVLLHTRWLTLKVSRWMINWEQVLIHSPTNTYWQRGNKQMITDGRRWESKWAYTYAMILITLRDEQLPLKIVLPLVLIWIHGMSYHWGQMIRKKKEWTIDGLVLKEDSVEMYFHSQKHPSPAINDWFLQLSCCHLIGCLFDSIFVVFFL